MARYIYEWKPTEHGARLFRRPGTSSAPAAPAEPALSTFKKDELIALAEERDLDPSGTKADIIERLEADDDEA